LAQSEEEMDILRMIYKDQDLVTPTRSPKPISQVAENITVIDSDEIEAINAHTLADVLLHVTGVQVDVLGGPNSVSSALIQGSDQRHVQLMVDGISLNNLSNGVADIGSFPVQRIERIEIIKGPASSAWGSSLGGIINIITRSPDPERRLGGMAYASVGERGSGDYRLDLSGTTGSAGYYLSAGGLTGDGLKPGNWTDSGNIYTKLQWEPAEKSRLQLAISYNKGARGDFQIPEFDQSGNDSFEYFYLTPSFSYAFTKELNLDISGRFLTKRYKSYTNQLSTGDELGHSIGDELNGGGSFKLAWRKGPSSLLIGFDYDHGSLETKDIEEGRQTQDRWAVFLNDTFTFGDFSITPGVRYDHTSTNGDFWSPSLGITYTLLEKTIFRAYAARGFNTPPLNATFANTTGELTGNSDLKPEEVWAYSVGVETSVLRYLWLKVTGFLHDINDVIDIFNSPTGAPPFTPVNRGKERRIGVEAEMRTVPLFGTSLMTGFTYIDAEDRKTDQEIRNVPRQTWDVGIDYYNEDILRGALRGHYVWWNAKSDQKGRYTAMIWDLNLSRSLLERGDLSLEAFFTAHNLFNGAQYQDSFFTNPRRWFEGGVRCRF
jgi:vitamin B12 transporter